MVTVTFSVPNINCGHCVHTIQSELSEIDGVSSVKAYANSKKVVVVFDNPATEEILRQSLTEINYPALP